MSTGRLNLDHNATTSLRPEARAAMVEALDCGGNPSSVHSAGRAARAKVEGAREAVAVLVGGRAANVIFTSGGSEANALALAPGKVTRLLIGAVEHACVLRGHRFAPDAVELVPVRPDGRIDLDVLDARLEELAARGETPLLALQLANNESGVLQPVREAADRVHAAKGRLHCDAVQAAGKVEIDFAALGADTLAISAHKIGGPQGVGALVVGEDIVLSPMLRGGGQERGLRSGTENVAGIAGFGAAAGVARLALTEEAVRLAALRDAFEEGLRTIAPERIVFAEGSRRLPNTSLFALRDLPAQTALIACDLEGLTLSSGSACSSGKVERSHVLAAMGVEPVIAACALRASFGWSSTRLDVSAALEIFANVVSALIQRRGKRAA